MKISVITPTCDRPIGMALAERMMVRQTMQPDEWIVADSGSTDAPCSAGQIHVRHPEQSPGAENFCRNLIRGMRRATGDVLIFWEDDDHYAPTHIETLIQQLREQPEALAAGDDQQRYYHVGRRCWRVFNNVGASLCQTAMRRGAVALFDRVVRKCLAGKQYGVDTTFWRQLPRAAWAVRRTATVLGIKGLPGGAGLGVGHRPNGHGWQADESLSMLRSWIGDDAEFYREFAEKVAA